MKIDARTNQTLFSFIYGSLNEDVRKQQWDSMNRITHHYKLPWAVIGDLNFIINQNEKEGGNVVSQSQLDKNREILDNANLHSLSFVGNPYTWTNRRQGQELILERLDRVTTTIDWMNNYPTAIVHHLVSIASDHCPILLSTAQNDNSTNKPFRFIRTWFRNSTCKEIIKSSWQHTHTGSAAFKHCKFLFGTKQSLRKWNYEHFGNISTQIAKNESQISNLLVDGHNMSSDVIIDLNKRLTFWYDAEEDYWKQRCKDDFFKLGDRNTRYFHNKANFKKKRTQIDTLQNNLGIWLSSRNEIADTLKSHFLNMSTTTNPSSPDKYLENIIPCITNEDNIMLTKKPSANEIKAIVFGMQSWTTQGPDGFPPGFYKEM